MILQELTKTRLYDAFSEMSCVHNQLNRLLDGYPSWHLSGENPPLNISVGDVAVKITAELPGLSAQDIDISLVSNTLTIKGEQAAQEPAPGETWHRRERTFGKFSRCVQLPFRIDANGVQATFKNGLLHLTLPRAEEDKPRRITVNVDQV
jgi:HSP20 family protein